MNPLINSFIITQGPCFPQQLWLLSLYLSRKGPHDFPKYFMHRNLLTRLKIKFKIALHFTYINHQKFHFLHPYFFTVLVPSWVTKIFQAALTISHMEILLISYVKHLFQGGLANFFFRKIDFKTKHKNYKFLFLPQFSLERGYFILFD